MVKVPFGQSLYMQNIQGTSSWEQIITHVPWNDIFASVWSYFKHLCTILRQQGMFKVLEYQSILEIRDAQGRRAAFKKREKVRYLQNNIIAYQDQAWGDGEILINYRCSPSVPVDT